MWEAALSREMAKTAPFPHRSAGQILPFETGRSNSLHSGVGHGSTGSYSSDCPCSPMSLQRSRRHPFSVMGSGHQDPQLT